MDILNKFETKTQNLTLSWRRYLPYRNQPFDLFCKLMDWFLYDRELRHERIKEERKKIPKI